MKERLIYLALALSALSAITYGGETLRPGLGFAALGALIWADLSIKARSATAPPPNRAAK